MTNSVTNTSAPRRRLNLSQQRLLSQVISNAQQVSGGHAITAPNGWSYQAKHEQGRTRWRVKDANGELFLWGWCA